MGLNVFFLCLDHNVGLSCYSGSSYSSLNYFSVAALAVVKLSLFDFDDSPANPNFVALLGR